MKRHYVSGEQRALLCQAYEDTPHPTYFQWKEIATLTNLEVQKVKRWFENHRHHIQNYQYRRLHNIHRTEHKPRIEIMDKETQTISPETISPGTTSSEATTPGETHILYPVITYVLVKKAR